MNMIKSAKISLAGNIVNMSAYVTLELKIRS